MNQIKNPYLKHQEEGGEEEDFQETSNVGDQCQRQMVLEDQKQKDTYMNNCLTTYTQGNMTTISNLNISKMNLSTGQTKSKQNIPTDNNENVSNNDDHYNFQKNTDIMDYPLATNDVSIMNNNSEQNDKPSHRIKETEQLNSQFKTRTSKQSKSDVEKKTIASKNIKHKYKDSISKKNLIIQIPDSDEEKKQKQVMKFKKNLQKEPTLADQQVKSKQDNLQRGGDTNDKKIGLENQESERVNEIIKNNQMEVENLQTIQIDYDFETIEGLSDDECLELFCLGSVKLKNSQRLYCKQAYEQLLIEKIRLTTRLQYSNLGILNKGNLSTNEFIQESVIFQLKRINDQFKTSDISQAFTVQCSDYIHSKLMTTISSSLNLYLVMSMVNIIAPIIKFQDSTYQKLLEAQISSVILALIQVISTYFYIIGVYACNNTNIRRGLFFNMLYFFLNIINAVVDSIICEYIKDAMNNTLYQRDNFHQFLFYLLSFLIGFFIPPYLYKYNQNTPTSVRKIVKMVSDEIID